ncbi:acyl-CoA N-acyltransferase [Gigaspora margarita]|uniref:histone acetyltransferase n=2 Tax=Gigaspora margarita TaxID=4874 RepID=A0A8H3X4N3_GIGMA|nr:acyl-CoA N-acyltransferase [Gigaspora margarita]
MATPYPPALKPIESLTLHEKLLKIGRNVPCTGDVQLGNIHNKCSCLGWKPKINNTGRADLCECGHRVSRHGDINSCSQDELQQRLEIAMKIDELLESKNKLLDFDYEDQEVRSLKRQLISIGETSSNNPTKRKFVDDSDSSSNVRKIIDRELNVPEKPAMIEEREGVIAMKVLTNNGDTENLKLLTGLKNLIKIQLPNMPPEYITRLVYDRQHFSLSIVKDGSRVVGGITYRLFPKNKLAEIVFCVVSSTEQAKGYGSHLMNHLKDHLKDNKGIKYLMTYADNHAMGFFKKNGFTTDITLERSLWMGFIKDYDEATIMQCTMIDKVKYLQLHKILAQQKLAIRIKIDEQKKNTRVYKGLHHIKNTKQPVDPMTIPGIKESGWTPVMEALARGNKKSIRNIMINITSELKKHPRSWPFRTPVNGDEVPDYYKVIKNPMDLSKIESKVENNCYKSIDEFAHDVRIIFHNCRIYNADGTVYVKCASGLEKYFDDRLKFYDVPVSSGKKKD